ncbi:glycerophosphodiester phosphodiesterase family protein [Marinicella rhabdoformis]|uniref:glycerophosphodiester phosphodiesterase family protein n=1 Tax=Marinicella rhabdoformis TaxID=2580566 RepID=UPI0012AEDCF2|nr:glycerophosphodiester phosphodiesterase family protein [Marinicella rhabdoformis]
MKKATWTLITLILITTAACKKNHPPINRVAHAGGGLENKRYTNTLEALDENYKRGFRLFELDLSWTSDNHLVCLHDWKSTAKRLLKLESGKPLTLTSFHQRAKEVYQWTPCDLSSLNNWLTKHPEAYIVTDIKGRIEKGHQLIADTLPKKLNQIIPQFTQKDHYNKIKDQGFSKMIWTLFSYNGTPKTLADDRRHMKLFAITMPKSKADAGWALTTGDTPTYVHTINDPKVAKHYTQNLGISSVYTDFLPSK